MEPGLLIALAFAAVIILLAVVLTWAFPSATRRDRHDLNASPADGRATATWIGVHAADNGEDGDH